MELINFWVCPKCNRSGNIYINKYLVKDIDKDIAGEEDSCPICKEKVIIEDFFKQAFKNENGNLEFMKVHSDTRMTGKGNIVVGKSYEITLEKEIEEIVCWNITKHGFFDAAIDVDNYIKFNDIKKFRTIRLLTSEYPGENSLKCGEESSLEFFIEGKTGKTFPIWFEFLRQSIQFIYEKKYSMSILSVEIAFESFIDNLLGKIFENKGISNESASQILELINNMDKKVYKLLKSIDNVNFKDMKNHKTWKKILTKRNKIAHGSNIKVDKEEAIEYYKFIIEAIFFINRKSSIDLIYKPI